MGKILSVATRPFRNFNIESRAHKIISKDKPVPAPKYKSDIETYQRAIEEHPDIFQESLKKHEVLDKHLRNVYVTSQDPEAKPLREPDPERPLPLDRRAIDDFEFGFKEPARIPHGRTTLRKVLHFLSDHHRDQKINDYVKIAEDHILPEEKVKSVLKYFRLYEVYLPEKGEHATFAGPTTPKVQIRTVKPKELPAGSTKKEEKT